MPYMSQKRLNVSFQQFVNKSTQSKSRSRILKALVLDPGFLRTQSCCKYNKVFQRYEARKIVFTIQVYHLSFFPKVTPGAPAQGVWRRRQDGSDSRSVRSPPSSKGEILLRQRGGHTPVLFVFRKPTCVLIVSTQIENLQ